jgi:hypothetical protein
MYMYGSTVQYMQPFNCLHWEQYVSKRIHEITSFGRDLSLDQNDGYKDGIMEILDQGNLHPKLEVPGLTCLGRESNPGLHCGRRAL